MLLVFILSFDSLVEYLELVWKHVEDLRVTGAVISECQKKKSGLKVPQARAGHVSMSLRVIFQRFLLERATC